MRSGRQVLWSEIGRALSIHPSTTSDVKTGKRPLRVDEIAVVARLLDCMAGWLAFGEGPMLPAHVTAGFPVVSEAELGFPLQEHIPVRKMAVGEAPPVTRKPTHKRKR